MEADESRKRNATPVASALSKFFKTFKRACDMSSHGKLWQNRIESEIQIVHFLGVHWTQWCNAQKAM